MKTINKILCVLIALIIIVGVVIWKNNGFKRIFALTSNQHHIP